VNTYRRVPIGDFRFTPRIIADFHQIFESGRVTYGPFLRRFESRFAGAHDRRHGVFCVSGTSALQVALRALRNVRRWEDGDEVLVPALTFVASSNAVLHERLAVKFVEVEPDFLGVDPARIEEQITSRTRAIMPVHLFGMPCRMGEIAEIAATHNLEIVEDCCQSTGARIDGKAVGSWSPLSCFSTYCGSAVFTGAGGLVLTDDDDLAVLARKLLAHGRDEKYLSIDDDDMLGDPSLLADIVQKRFCFVELGYSLRMTEFEGAMGLAQIEGLDEILAARRKNAEFLTAALGDLEVLELPKDRPNARRAFRMFPIRVKETARRNPLCFFLERHGVETRPLFPLLEQPYYVRRFGDIAGRYPIARDASNAGFYIGCHEYLEQADLDYTVDLIRRGLR
jgi:dTDP-4-amino-4,6-dideoxygalactose transaminase